MENREVLLVVLFWVNCCVAQVSLSGVITDSLNSPLPYANVLAKPDSADLAMTFSISDEQGRYTLSLEKGFPYTIDVTYLGYKKESFSVSINEDVKKNIELKVSTDRLDEIVIINESPVLVKEDTIRFKTDVFVDGQERKLKQVLQKLPGVEVDREGNVLVNGKRVTDLLVDGKKFFDGSTKLGVENIPADAVAEVEVIDNYNRVSFLKDLSDSERMALDIKLKQDKNKFIFGDIEAGAGTNEHYLMHPSLFYYSPKTKVNLIGDVNDIGVKSFTLKDYMNFEGGMGKLLLEPGSFYKLSNNDFSNFLRNNDFEAAKNNFAAFNINQMISKKIEATAYAILSDTQTVLREENLNQYLQPDAIVNEVKLTKGESSDRFLLSKISVDFKPGFREDISYSGFFKYNKNNFDEHILSETNEGENNFDTQLNNSGTSFKQNFEWHKKFSGQITNSFSVNYNYDRTNPFSKWISDEQILPGLLPIVPQELYDLSQTVKLKIHHLKALYKFYWVLNNRNHIYFTIGNNVLQEDYFTNTYQLLNSGEENNFYERGFGNDLAFSLNDFFVRVQHKFRIGDLTTKYGISAHRYDWNADQSVGVNDNKWVLLPDFLATYEITKSEKIQLKYDLKSSWEDAPKFANRFLLSNYNAVFKGNENLENGLYHAARMWYTKFSLYRGIILNGSIRYNRIIESVKNAVVIEGINFYSSPILFDQPETQWGINAGIRKNIWKFVLSGKADVSWSDYFQQLNNEFSKVASEGQNYGLSLKTNFNKFPEIELGYNFSINNYISIYSDTEFRTQKPYVLLTYRFLEDFFLEADYSKFFYTNFKGQRNSYENANASLSYQKEDSAWRFTISGTNILDARYKYQNTFSDYLITDQRNYIIPRIWMLKVIYSL